jgi:hypothetical protein
MSGSSNYPAVMFDQISFFPYLQHLQSAAEIFLDHFVTDYHLGRSLVRISLTIVVSISLFLYSCAALHLSSEQSIDRHFSLFESPSLGLS